MDEERLAALWLEGRSTREIATALHVTLDQVRGKARRMGLPKRYLYKNGERTIDVAVEVVENPDGFYTFSFDNDGTDEATWTLIVYQTSSGTLKFGESWKVRKRTVELNVKQIRSRQDSEGGFFKSSYDKEV